MQREFYEIETLCHKDDPRDLVLLLKEFLWLEIYEEEYWPSKDLFRRYKRVKALIFSNLDKVFDGSGYLIYDRYKNKYHYLSDDELEVVTKIGDVVANYKNSIHDIILDGMTFITLVVKKISSYF